MDFFIITVGIVLFYCLIGAIPLVNLFLFKNFFLARKLLNLTIFSTLLPNKKTEYLLAKSVLDNFDNKPDEALAELTRITKQGLLNLPFGRRWIAAGQIVKVLTLKGEHKKSTELAEELKSLVTNNLESEKIWEIWENCLNGMKK